MATTSAEFIRRSIAAPDEFWAEQAARIDWHRPFDRVCDSAKSPVRGNGSPRGTDEPVPTATPSTATRPRRPSAPR